MFVSLRLVATGGVIATLLMIAPAISGPSQTSASMPDYTDGAIHLYRTPEQWRRIGRFPNLGTAGKMEYFGGSVFAKVKVVSVLWGPNVNSTTVKAIPAFLTALPNSTYVDQLAPQYDTDLTAVNGHKGTNQTIGRGTFLGQFQITPIIQSTTLTDKDIHVEIANQISQGTLPKNDLETLYMIYFPSNITIVLGKAQSCRDFGAYHSSAVHLRLARDNLFYGVMPDCSPSFKFITIVSSHEFAEATTDNIPTPGSHPNFPQAWNTSNGFEIGDLCEGTLATLTDGTRSWQVQEVYLNTKAACGTGNFTSP
jgi:hypothetical protein